LSRFYRLPVITAFIILISAGIVSAETDLLPLFSEATIDEIAQLRQDWITRPTDATSFTHDRFAERDGFTISRVSFNYEGLKQYGMVRFPRHYSADGSFPVVIYHHGGEQGLYYVSAADFDETFPTGCVADSAFVLAPTYRGETFSGSDVLGNRLSEGELSLWDRDCDDAMAMLTAFLAVTPEADIHRITSFGRSRGATVAYHMAVRDHRVRRSVIMFGASNFRHENIINDCQLEVDDGIAATNTLSRKVMANIVWPWLQGEKSLADARQMLNGWSIRYTLNGNVKMQVHHGDTDEAIVIDHAILVDEIMNQWGAGLPGYAFFSYPGAGHNPFDFDGYEVRVEDFICLPDPGSISSAPMFLAPAVLAAWPNPFTSRITDLRGRLVRRLERKNSAGEFIWDGFDRRGIEVPAGVYLAVTENPGTGAGADGAIRGKRILKLR